MYPCVRDQLRRHNVRRVQSSSHRPTFAMNSNGTFGLFDNCQKLQCDCVTRCTAIGKEQIEVFEAHVDKALGIVDLLIQADNARHIPLAKIGEIRIRCVQWVTLDGKIPVVDRTNREGRLCTTYVLDFTLGMWTRERQQLSRYNPVQITIFHFLDGTCRVWKREERFTYFVMFVIVEIEILEVEKAMKNRLAREDGRMD